MSRQSRRGGRIVAAEMTTVDVVFPYFFFFIFIFHRTWFSLFLLSSILGTFLFLSALLLLVFLLLLLFCLDLPQWCHFLWLLSVVVIFLVTPNACRQMIATCHELWGDRTCGMVTCQPTDKCGCLTRKHYYHFRSALDRVESESGKTLSLSTLF